MEDFKDRFKVYIDRKNHQKYQDLCKRGSGQKSTSEAPFSNMHHVYIISVIFGYRYKAFLEIDNPIDIFESNTLAKQPEQLSVLYSIIHAHFQDNTQKSEEILLSPKSILKITDKYANGGFMIFYNKLLEMDCGDNLQNLMYLSIDELKDN